MPLEIERRFLLKKSNESLLREIGCDVFLITQYYVQEEGNIVRYRRKEKFYNKNSDWSVKYYKTVKKYISLGTFEEIEEEVDREIVVNAIQSNVGKVRCVSKYRYIVNDEKQDLKFEIDLFNFSIVILEVELPNINHEFKMPPFLQDSIILEITGQKEFSNYNLSEFLSPDFKAMYL